MRQCAPKLPAPHELLNELEDRLIYENDAFDLNITQVNVSDLAHRVAIGHEGGFAQKNWILSTILSRT